jgi:prepilin-type N-terminal cleavage/methylation domain-containing protein
MRKNVEEQIRSGFTLIEVLVAIAIIGIIAAFTIPNLVSTKRAVHEQTLKMRLADIASRQTTYRLAINRGMYATLDDLKRATLPDGRPLLSDEELNIQGWTISDIQVANRANSFGIQAVPTTGGARYCIYQDGILRREIDGDCKVDSSVVPMY